QQRTAWGRTPPPRARVSCDVGCTHLASLYARLLFATEHAWWHGRRAGFGSLLSPRQRRTASAGPGWCSALLRCHHREEFFQDVKKQASTSPEGTSGRQGPVKGDRR